MGDILQTLAVEAGFGGTVLRPLFDAERDTPELLEAVTSQFPEIRQIVGSLRRELPLAPHSRIGAIGSFVRIPNHYRSLTCLIRSSETGATGAIVFKGTEPLLPDFTEYLDWMLRAPFRMSCLPLGLHFPLDMKLPPGAMWLTECLLEQDISSRIQAEYLLHFERLARLPVPLFVFELRPEQVHRYTDVVRARLPSVMFAIHSLPYWLLRLV